MGRVRALAILMICAATAGRAAAQPVNLWARGTELGLLAGGAASSSISGPMLAGTIDWDVSRWTAIEGRGSWLGRGAGAEAFAFDLSAFVNVIAKRTVTPFVGAGFGMYRATFDSGASDMSSFYRARARPALVTESFSFTDPAWRFTGGVDVIARRSISIRPEASLLVVVGDGRRDTLVTFGVRLGYRFEDHPITP